jgi:5-carboxymethyl-2-hydroxymuconate isomerase
MVVDSGQFPFGDIKVRFINVVTRTNSSQERAPIAQLAERQSHNPEHVP